MEYFCNLDKLHLLLEEATVNKERLEIVTNHNERFTARPIGVDDGEDDLSCTFRETGEWPYSLIYLKDISSVRRIGETDYAYIAEIELVEAV